MFETIWWYDYPDEEEEEFDDPVFASLASNWNYDIMPTSIKDNGLNLTVNVANLDTSNVTNMSRMFAGIDIMPDVGVGSGSGGSIFGPPVATDYALTIRGLESLDVSNVRIMDEMFQYLPLETITIPETWNTSSKLTSMRNMFRGCWNLNKIENLDKLDTSHVTDIYGMFSKLPALPEGIDGLDTSNVTNMARLFRDFTGTSITIPDTWNFSKVETISRMFDRCPNLENIDYGSSWDTSNVKDMSWIYSRCLHSGDVLTVHKNDASGPCCWNDISILHLDKYDTSNMEDMSGLFQCYTGTSLVFPSNFDMSKVKDVKQMFKYCSRLTSVEFGENWDTSNVENMGELFSYCISMTTIDCSNWDVRKVKDMSEMFNGKGSTNSAWDNCTSINITGWETDSLENIDNMFVGRISLVDIYGLNQLDVSHVKKMNGTFDQCSSLKILDLSNWNTSQVQEMRRTFGSCHDLETIIVGDKWDLTNVKYYTNLFENCKSLNLDCTKWKVSDVFYTQTVNKNAPGVILSTT